MSEVEKAKESPNFSKLFFKFKYYKKKNGEKNK
jgi:hypothetical protein